VKPESQQARYDLHISFILIKMSRGSLGSWEFIETNSNPIPSCRVTPPILSLHDGTSDLSAEIPAIPLPSHLRSGSVCHSSIDYIQGNDWRSLEDELASLVKEGRLDFSFLSELDLPVVDDRSFF